jgi:anti-sigma factor RsiW
VSGAAVIIALVTVDELDQEIRAAEARSTELKRSLEDLRAQIADEYGRFAAEWVPETAKRELVNNPDATTQHKAELPQLKSAVAELSERMPQLIAEALKDDGACRMPAGSQTKSWAPSGAYTTRSRMSKIWRRMLSGYWANSWSRAAS